VVRSGARIHRTAVTTVDDAISIVVEVGTTVAVLKAVAILRLVRAAIGVAQHAITIGIVVRRRRGVRETQASHGPPIRIPETRVEAQSSTYHGGEER
jgi:hypothetical protein